jgi:hypothetical protein
MASESQLGEAYIPIRATLDKLDGDLKQVRTKVGGAMKSIETDSGKSGGALKALKTQFADLGKQVPALGTAFSLLTNPITLAAGGLGIFAGIAKESIGIASDLSETVSKVGIVFGDEKDTVMDFGKGAAASLGMSENAALSAAGVYGNLFRSMEMGEDVSARMSTGLVQLAGDLASFNNMDPTEVADKLRAMLSGETEPGKSLGININEVTIKERALELALWDGIGALDASAKAQAVYSLIMEQTKLAQGDFARTSAGLANQQRIQKAETENLKAALGELLLPTTVAVTSAFVDFVQILNGTYDASQHAEDGVSGIDKAMGGLEAGVSGIKDAGNILSFFGAVAKKIFTTGATPEVIAKLRYEYFALHGDVKILAEEEDRLIAVHNQLTPTIKDVGDTAADAADNGVAPLVGDMKDLHAQAALDQVAMAKFALEGVTRLDDALDSLVKEAISGYTSSMSEAMVMQAAWDLAMGNITQATYDQIVSQAPLIDNFEQLGQLLKDKKITWDYYFQAIKDGKVTNEEMIAALIATGMKAEEARLKVEGLTDAINNMPERKQINFDVVYNTANPPPGDWGDAPIMDAYGGIDYVTSPTLFMAGERVPETVIAIPSDANQDLIIQAMMGLSGLLNIQDSSDMKMPAMAMELERGNGFTGNQYQQPAEPITVIFQGIPEDDMEKRRLARYVVDEIKRRKS